MPDGNNVEQDQPASSDDAVSQTSRSGRGRLGPTLVLSLGGAAIGALGAFAVAAIVGRQLGAAGAGIFFQFVAVFTIALTVVKMGGDTGLVRTMAQLRALHHHEEIGGVLWRALIPVAVFGAIVAGAAVLMAPWLAELLTSGADRQEAERILVYLPWLIAVAAILYLVLGALRGLGSVAGFVAVLNVGLPLARVGLVAAILAAGFGAVGAVLAWAGSIPVWLVIAAALLYRAIRKARAEDVASSPPSDKGTSIASFRSFWGFSLGRWAAATVEIILDWVDVLLVGALLSPAAAGTYAVATRVIRAGQVVDNAMRVAVGPRISANMVLGDTVAVAALFRTASQAMLVLALPFYVTCFVFAETILSFFGPEFSDGAVALRVLAVGMTISASTVLAQSVVLMAGRSHWQLRNKSIALVVVIIGNLLLVPHIGIAGAALAWALGISTDAVLVSRQTGRLIGSHGQFWGVLKPLLIVGAAVGLIGAVVRTTTGDDPIALGLHLVIVLLVYLFGVAVAVRRSGSSLRDVVGKLRSGG